jgi:hypothetical protein
MGLIRRGEGDQRHSMHDSVCVGLWFSYCQNLSLNDILKLVFVLFLTL